MVNIMSTVNLGGTQPRKKYDRHPCEFQALVAHLCSSLASFCHSPCAIVSLALPIVLN